MPTISVTGATGFIGRHLIRNLLERPQLRVRALVHDAGEATLPRAERLTWVRGDLGDVASLGDLVAAGGDVVNLAFPRDWSREQHCSATANLAKVAADAGARRVVHCSTAVVTGRAPARLVVETTAPEPASEYEQTKLAIEAAWLAACGTGVELTILRPTAVFGPYGRNLVKLASDLERRSPLINYLKSCLQGARRMNLVHVDNVVAALIFLLQATDGVAGETFIISDDESPLNNYRDVERRLMTGLGIRDYPVAPVCAPRWMLSAALRAAGRTNVNPDRIYDCSKIIGRGLKKPVPFEHGLSDFVAWYRARDTGAAAS